MQFISFVHPEKLSNIVGAVLRRSGMTEFTRLEQLCSGVQMQEKRASEKQLNVIMQKALYCLLLPYLHILKLLCTHLCIT